MSARDCINRAHAAGFLTDEDLKNAHRLYDDIAAHYGRSFGPTTSDVEVARAVIERLKAAALEKKRAVLLQRQATQSTLERVTAQKTVKGEADPAGGLDSLMEADDLNRSNVPGYREHAEAILGQAQSRMVGILETFRATITGGKRNPALMKDLVRELHGEDTGVAAAKELAEAWRQTAEWLRLRFNAAGGAIGRLKDWGLPHSHDSLKVRQAGREAWIDYIKPLLDRDRMIDRSTGVAFEPGELRNALREIYDSIASEGWIKRTPQQRAIGSAIAAKRADARFLVFKDADSWMRYDARFGDADPFNAMQGHVDSMAKDIAAMELFGPSPTATLHYAEQTVLKQAAEADAAAGGTENYDRAVAMGRRMWNAYDLMRGNANRPMAPKWAYALATTRTLIGAAQLGKAALGAISDFNFHRLAAQMNGLRATGVMKHYIELWASADARREAVRAGLIAENWSTLALAQKRYTDQFLGSQFASRVSHFVMTSTGLSPHTQFGKWAFGMEFMGTLADHAGQTFKELPAPLQNALDRHGIGAFEWDTARRAPVYEARGSSFLRPVDIAEVNQAVGDRFLSMIKAETEYAVPSFSLRGKAMFLGKGTEPGTLAGEALRSPLMYKSFGLTLTMTHLRRRALELSADWSAGNVGHQALRNLDFIITSTALGALAYQLKQIVAGRDPAPMDNAEFWGAAFLQSGGIGAYSDFLFADYNAYGRGLAEMMFGPVGNLAADTAKLTAGNVQQLIAGKDTNFGREAVDFLNRYTPGGNMWYAQIATQRLLFDRLALWADPRARERMARMETRYRNQRNQGLWWRPGELAPDRAPDLANTLGE